MNTTPPRVLVVDDDPIFRAIAQETLRSMAAEVVEAEDGQEALTLLGVQAFDLVITDINMPNRDGIELMFEMHRRWPEIKLVAISGGTQKAGPDLFLRTAGLLGAVTHSKPVPPKALLELVARALAQPGEPLQAKPAVG